MQAFTLELIKPITLLTVALFAFTGVLWLFVGDGINKLRHPEEWADKGKAGEQSTYLEITRTLGISSKQVLRNVYIPTNSGTTEIDLLIVSRKGLLVFECKNYSGNVYGDGDKKYWVQYLGKKKSYFLSPVVQNHSHVKHLREFFADSMPKLPVIPFVATTGNANWKLRNINPGDHVLYWTGSHLADIYRKLPDSKVAIENEDEIIAKLKPYERPDEKIRREHIEQAGRLRR